MNNDTNKPVTPAFPPALCDSMGAFYRANVENGELRHKVQYTWWRDGFLQAVSPVLAATKDGKEV